MSDKLRNLIDVAEAASSIRRICVGAPLEYEELSTHVIEGHNKADFDGLVSRLYIVWHEHWKQDVKFFSDNGGDTIDTFSALIVVLRTGAQHAADEKVREIFDLWIESNRGSSTDWTMCIDALFDAALEAFLALAGAMNDIRENSTAVSRWKQTEELSARSSVAAVAQDMGLSLPENILERHSREVDKRLRHHPPTTNQDLQSTVDAYAMQQLISWGWSRPINVDYYSLLEEFELLAHRDARDFLRLAHVVESVTQTARRRADFVRILKQSWSFLVKQRL